MKIFDAHCDTITKILDENVSLYKNRCHCDLKRMQKYENFAQFFAVCVLPKFMGHNAFIRADKMLDAFLKDASLFEKYISICFSYDDFLGAQRNNKVAAFLTLEGASPLDGKIENLEYFYKRGVRLITLTWNHKNELGCGAVTAYKYDKSERGLTAFGKDIVRKMDDMGIIVDVSHLSDEGFYDLLDISQRPFMASHSNARSICEHKRNLTDDMIKIIADKRGFIGINLYPIFVSNNANEANIDKILRHIEHIVSLIGIKNIGLGCDFDGIEKTPAGIRDIKDISKLTDRLLQLNYPQTFVENFTYGNLERFMKTFFTIA